MSVSGLMSIRQHRGSLSDSLETMKQIEPTLEGIRQYMRESQFSFSDAELKSVEVKEYYNRPDARINWDKTYTVTYVPDFGSSRGVFGMCDRMVEQ